MNHTGNTAPAPFAQALQTLSLFCVAIAFVAASFAWQGHIGFNLWDEGYLWYGVQRVMAGEVPLLDFMSYDPGRYYWSAAILRIFRIEGISALRFAVASFQTVGLMCALWLVTSKRSGSPIEKLVFTAACGIICMLWMFPRHKLFDASISIILVLNLHLLLSSPSPKLFFFSGVCTGLAAVFGRNHGIYGVFGSLVVFTWIFLNVSERVDLGRKIALWAIGILAGFSPIFLMSIILPGFSASFIESILFIFEQRSTNLPLPIPWPWNVTYANTALEYSIRGFLIGAFFIAVAMFAAISLIWIFWRRRHGLHVSNTVVAASALAIPYAHFAYSRADIGHLALGIFPLIIWSLFFLGSLRKLWKWWGTAALVFTSGWVMLFFHPGWQCRVMLQCTNVEISGNQLLIDPITASDIQLLRRLVDENAPNDQYFIATPVWPGAYALFNRKSPMWAIYALWTRKNSAQELDIDRIKKADPKFALIFDLALDGREDLRFKNTNPLVNRFILDNFDRMEISSNPAYQIFRSRNHLASPMTDVTPN